MAMGVWKLQRTLCKPVPSSACHIGRQDIVFTLLLLRAASSRSSHSGGKLAIFRSFNFNPLCTKTEPDLICLQRSLFLPRSLPLERNYTLVSWTSATRVNVAKARRPRLKASLNSWYADCADLIEYSPVSYLNSCPQISVTSLCLAFRSTNEPKNKVTLTRSRGKMPETVANSAMTLVSEAISTAE